MSEQTSTPSDDQEPERSFVDGFGRSEDAGEQEETVEQEGVAAAFETDVEGTSTEPAPGDRNEPV